MTEVVADLLQGPAFAEQSRRTRVAQRVWSVMPSPDTADQQRVTHDQQRVTHDAPEGAAGDRSLGGERREKHLARLATRADVGDVAHEGFADFLRQRVQLDAVAESSHPQRDVPAARTKSGMSPLSSYASGSMRARAPFRPPSR
jgi:hypothetical protein